MECIRKDYSWSRFYKETAGFTLIEISIVIVIIGLIIGGVLVGKDLVKSAEIRAAVSEISAIQAGILVFKNKYNALSGDMRDATSIWPGATSNGDGDGFFETSDSAQDQEGGYLWHHMGLAQVYKTFTRPNAANFSNIPGINTPQILPGTAATGQRRNQTSTHRRYGSTLNYIQLGKYNGASGGSITCAAVDSMTAHAIDSKYDDGVPSSGKVLAYVTSTCAVIAPTCTDYPGDYVGGDYDYHQPPGSVSYDFNTPDSACRMAFLIHLQ